MESAMHKLFSTFIKRAWVVLFFVLHCAPKLICVDVSGDNINEQKEK